MEQRARTSPGRFGQAEPRLVTVLGSTGSIGRNTLDLIARNRDAFQVAALTANANVALLAEQARRFNASLAVVADETAYRALKDMLSGTGIEARAGAQAIIEAAARPADVVMASIVGAAGLRPTLEALKSGRIVALANKECLVTAGELFMAEVRRRGATLIPVDSEHNAIFQVLDAASTARMERIVLTASGGPFRTWEAGDIAAATPRQALNHPNWKMGDKLTIDSATMMNKGLELIEAHHLFGASRDQLDVLIHPQSVIHSMVEYVDGCVLAQLGMPDMRTPISYTLAWPERMAAPSPRLDLREIGALTFEAVDPDRFPAVNLCLSCLDLPSSAASVLNAANEVAVAAFLAGRIGFNEIVTIVERCLDLAEKDGNIRMLDDLADVLDVDAATRAEAGRIIG